MTGSQKSSEKQKKKRSILPYRFVHHESVELVASPIGPIEISPLSQVDKTILLDRLHKEIIRVFDFTLSPISLKQSKRPRTDDSPYVDTLTHTQDSSILISLLRLRLSVGINSCTRALERMFPPSASNRAVQLEKVSKPSLVILARDIRPPTMLVHIPYYCHLLKVPILLLPGRASVDMGKLLGAKSASIIIFFQRPDNKYEDEKSSGYHNIVDSFIEFAKSIQPTTLD